MRAIGFVAVYVACAACGHTYSASLGASRRSDGTLGAVATVGADFHWLSAGRRGAIYVLSGARIGVGVDRDGATRLVLDVGDAIGRLPRSTGWAARADLRAGSDLRAALTGGVGWQRWTRERSWDFHES